MIKYIPIVTVNLCLFTQLQFSIKCLQLLSGIATYKDILTRGQVIWVVLHPCQGINIQFSFLVSPSQLQKRNPAPRYDGLLEEQLGTTWGYKNKINEKRLLSDPVSGTQKLFPLSLVWGSKKSKSTGWETHCPTGRLIGYFICCVGLISRCSLKWQILTFFLNQFLVGNFYPKLCKRYTRFSFSKLGFVCKNLLFIVVLLTS